MPLVCGVIGLGHGSVVRHSHAFVRSHAVVIVKGNGIAGGHVHPHVVGELAGLAIGGLGRIDAAVLVDLGIALNRVAGIHGHGSLLGPLLQLGVVDLLTVLAGDRAGVVAGSVGLEHGLAVQIQLADDGVCGERILQLGRLGAVGQDRLQGAAVRGRRQGGRAAVRQDHVGLDIGLVGHGPVTGHIDAIALLNQGDVAVPLRVLVLQRHRGAGDGGAVGVLQGHRDPVAQVDSGAFLVSGGLPVLGSMGCEGDAFEVAGNFDNLIGVGPGAIAVLDRFPSLLHSVAGLVQGHSSSRIRGGHHNFKRVAQEVGRGRVGLGLDGDGQIPAGLSVAVFTDNLKVGVGGLARNSPVGSVPAEDDGRGLAWGHKRVTISIICHISRRLDCNSIGLITPNCGKGAILQRILGSGMGIALMHTLHLNSIFAQQFDDGIISEVSRLALAFAEQVDVEPTVIHHSQTELIPIKLEGEVCISNLSMDFDPLDIVGRYALVPSIISPNRDFYVIDREPSIFVVPLIGVNTLQITNSAVVVGIPNLASSYQGHTVDNDIVNIHVGTMFLVIVLFRP